MATYDENKRFVADLLSASLLDDAVHWIRNNLSPEEVFDDDQLIEYVKESADVDDVYETSDIIAYVSATCTPAEVFSEQELAAWAAEQGWIQKPH